MTTRRLALLALLAAMGILASVISPAAASPSDVDPAETCQRLLQGDGGRVDQVEVVDGAGELPEYCRVIGTLSGTINYEARMPTNAWNGKFYMTGCGGFCGNVNADACNGALARGYAVVATDGGHTASALDGSWGLDNRRAEVDWAYLAVHRVAANTKQLITKFYRTPPAYSYFSGCSGGGREALVSAERFPKDFDGIIAGAPANRQAFLAGVSQTWIEQAQFDDEGTRIFGTDKLGLIGQATYEQCDAIDGLIDGQIDDPRNCDFDPADLGCPSDAIGPDCLSPDEVEAAQKIYDSPRNSAGDALYPGGLPAGSEELWAFLSVGFGDNLSIGGNFAQDYHRYLGYRQDPGESFSIFDFDFDNDVKNLKPKSKLYNATSPNLRRFNANGGKLMIYHGYADPLITPFGTIAYYEDIERWVDDPDKTRDFARLFMLPGMSHCGGGPGPSVVDFLTPLENWVEHGIAPDQVVASRFAADGNVDRTRPVFPYPLVARHDGIGSTDDAASFVPVRP